MQTYKTIDEYIKQFPEDIQETLQKIREVIHKSAPEATEAIKYGMPTFVLNKNLVHFAAFKKHIGFYPTPSGITAFDKELKGYPTSKGAIQFPYTQPVPYNLIRTITLYRVKECLQSSH